MTESNKGVELNILVIGAFNLQSTLLLIRQFDISSRLYGRCEPSRLSVHIILRPDQQNIRTVASLTLLSSWYSGVFRVCSRRGCRFSGVNKFAVESFVLQRNYTSWKTRHVCNCEEFGTQARSTLIAVQCPLKNVSPSIVSLDADLEKVADSLVFEKFLNAGQLCLMTGYLILFGRKRKEELANVMKKHIEKNFTANAQNLHRLVV
ncbi:Aldehyde dehydrogenase [Aphelenchoides besseyi]|nr:Aldehyde dehydrogenase [Aphelenchoides besseyi]KAI6208610.1 Aldehyde dehydrogenase [Aphelenchoides besseyi]